MYNSIVYSKAKHFFLLELHLCLPKCLITTFPFFLPSSSSSCHNKGIRSLHDLHRLWYWCCKGEAVPVAVIIFHVMKV